MNVRTACLLALLPLGGFAQDAPIPAFDVASIRASDARGESLQREPASITMRNNRLASIIAWAYDVEEYQLSGPTWMNDARFDVIAKSAGEVKEPEQRRMMQKLLADRFRLAVHRQTREMTALILTVAKTGSKLEPGNPDDASNFTTGKMNLTGKNATIAQLAHFFSHEIHIPVIDQTGLTGKYNYFLDINAYVTEEIRKSEGPNGGPPPEASSIVAQAVQAQLGLKLDSRKAAVEVVVVDHLERTPTDN